MEYKQEASAFGLADGEAGGASTWDIEAGGAEDDPQVFAVNIAGAEDDPQLRAVNIAKSPPGLRATSASQTSTDTGPLSSSKGFGEGPCSVRRPARVVLAGSELVAQQLSRRYPSFDSDWESHPSGGHQWNLAARLEDNGEGDASVSASLCPQTAGPDFIAPRALTDAEYKDSAARWAAAIELSTQQTRDMTPQVTSAFGDLQKIMAQLERRLSAVEAPSAPTPRTTHVTDEPPICDEKDGILDASVVNLPASAFVSGPAPRVGPASRARPLSTPDSERDRARSWPAQDRRALPFMVAARPNIP